MHLSSFDKVGVKYQLYDCPTGQICRKAIVMTLLKNTLVLNAANSLVSGGILLAFPKAVGIFIGFESTYPLQVLGVLLVIFSLFVAFASRSLNTFLVKSIVFQDITWVIGSLIVLVFNPWNFSDKGLLLVAMMMVIVGLFAVFQWRALKRLEPNRF
jgi:hypothetical protein